MFINKVLAWYEKSYYKAAQGKESARGLINSVKSKSGESGEGFYQKIKRLVLRYLIGDLYWPTTWPTSIDPPTAGLLYSLVRLYRPEIAVEIGTYKGNAAIAIGQALKDNNSGNLYTIDPFEQEIVRTAIRKANLQDIVVFKKGYSQEVLPSLKLSKVDFAFIDGDHSYESVSRDFGLVERLVPKGGIVIFHDVLVAPEQGFDGPRKVISEIEAKAEWRVCILDTEVGVNSEKKVILRGDDPTFVPVGLAICIKK